MQAGKLWFANGDVYEGQMKNWKFDGQGKFSVALTGLSYEGIWTQNSLPVGKFSYQNGFSATGQIWAPVFER